MRLLSFLTLVEQQLVLTQPGLSTGWQRRVNYQAGSAALAHAASGLTLVLRSTTLANGSLNLQANWHGVDGRQIDGTPFFSGGTDFSWAAAAREVATQIPAPALNPGAEVWPAASAASIPA